MTMRIMGLDYGSKTVGVAVSDPLGITAQGVETICRKDENKLRKTCARIEALIEEYQVTKIVLGLPKHMNNDIGDRAEKSMAFGEMLKRRTGLEVVMWDERLTTVEAERTLMKTARSILIRLRLFLYCRDIWIHLRIRPWIKRWIIDGKD